MQPGKFIVFEGGEGSGKTEHVKRTSKWLQERKYEVVITHEPGGTTLGQEIRNLLLHNHEEVIAPPAELFLFLADRAQHVHTLIIPSLNEGKQVISDRFTGSTLAYQIGARGLTNAELIYAMEAYSREQLVPDLVIYLDIPPEVGIQRKHKQMGEDMNKFDNESLEFHSRVRDYFQKLAKEQTNWVMLDANQSIEAVQNLIQGQLQSLYQ